MARVQEKFPVVFVACPFKEDRVFNRRVFKERLGHLPWNLVFADDKIRSDQLLKRAEDDIKTSDFVLVDITGWNANVSLELGLAKGLGVEYRIIRNSKDANKDVYADLKGIQRIDYAKATGQKAYDTLFKELVDKVFKKQYFSKKLWTKLSNKERSEDRFEFALWILSHFKNSEATISKEKLNNLKRGFHFKKGEGDEVIDLLCQEKLLKRKGKGGVIRLGKQIYNKVKGN
ncbi:MAG: hypothetical protein U0T74_14145 [Chitinophagales bacterium]